MKNTIKLLFIFFILCTNSAFAAWDNGGIANAHVIRVTILIDGSFYIEFDKDICDGGSTINKIGYVYKNSAPNGHVWNAEGADMLLKVALAAKLSGNATKVFADDSGTEWGCKLGALALE